MDSNFFFSIYIHKGTCLKNNPLPLPQVVNMRKREQTKEEIELAKAMREALERDHKFAVPDPKVVGQFRKETLLFEE